jgi:hypothetical protein
MYPQRAIRTASLLEAELGSSEPLAEEWPLQSLQPLDDGFPAGGDEDLVGLHSQLPARDVPLRLGLGLAETAERRYPAAAWGRMAEDSDADLEAGGPGSSGKSKHQQHHQKHAGGHGSSGGSNGNEQEDLDDNATTTEDSDAADALGAAASQAKDALGSAAAKANDFYDEYKAQAKSDFVTALTFGKSMSKGMGAFIWAVMLLVFMVSSCLCCCYCIRRRNPAPRAAAPAARS